MDTVDAEAGEKNAGKSKDDALNAHAKALRDCAMLELLYATGMRVGELVGLDMGSFDWSNRTVRVLGKGNKTRVILFGAPHNRQLSTGCTGKAGIREWEQRQRGVHWCTWVPHRPACGASGGA